MKAGNANFVLFFTFLCLLLSFQFVNGQVSAKMIVGKWEMQKHVYDGDTTDMNPDGVSRVYIFLWDGTYKYIITRNDIIKGVFVEDGKWKLMKKGTVIFLYERKEKSSPPLRNLQIELVRLTVDKLELIEMGVSGEEGMFGVSHYLRIK